MATKAIFDLSPGMSVGSGVFDEDHRVVLELAALLQDIRPGAEHRALVLSVIGVLDECLGGHFLREERAMRLGGHYRFAEHRQEHVQFRRRIRADLAAYRDGLMAVAGDLPYMVAAWVRRHILLEDRAYDGWNKGKRIDRRPLAFLALEAEPKVRRR